MAEENKKTVNLTNYILVFLLAVAAFLGGMVVKDFLNKGSSSSKGEVRVAQPSPAPAKQAAGQPETVVLGEEDQAEIEKGGAATKGAKDAPITIVEFSEYQCPWCQRYVEETYSQIFDEYGGQIYYIFRDYPLPFHQHAQKMAEAARCAGDQEKYWLMHDLLFEKRDDWVNEEKVDDKLMAYAKSLNLDLDQFSSCLDSGQHTQAVKDDVELGKKMGVSGTPSFFVNGQLLVGAQPFSAFKKLIDAQLEK